MTRLRALLLTVAVAAAFLSSAATRTSQLITFTLGSTAITLGTTTTTVAGLTLTTPVLGVATATSINKVAITAPATSATLTIQDGTTLTYAQGTWSPTIVGGSTPGTGQTYSTQVGSYEQIGRQVIVRFNITATSLGTAAGNTQIGNLPVTSVNTANEFGMCYMATYTVAGLPALNYGISAEILPNSSTMILFTNGSTGSSSISIAQSGASASFQGYCSYRAS